MALIYLSSAGDMANRRSAYSEAIAHVTQGLAVLGTLPETAVRADQEIRLRLALARSLMARNGAIVGTPDSVIKKLTDRYYACRLIPKTGRCW